MHKKIVKMSWSFIIDILLSKKLKDNYFIQASCTSLAGKLTICKKNIYLLIFLLFLCGGKYVGTFSTLFIDTHKLLGERMIVAR